MPNIARLQHVLPTADRFSGEWWGDLFLDIPIRLAGLFIGAIVLRYILHKIIDKTVAKAIKAKPSRIALRTTRAARVVFGKHEDDPVVSRRRTLRTTTLGSALKSSVTLVIAAITIVMTLEILGYSIGPLLASAGIAGMALGFGAQNLVKDFLAGTAMLLEDQFGVGDYIDMGEVSGIVEAVSLRVTRIRDLDGTVWYIRNGEVSRLGNSSQDWARAVVDVYVDYASDINRVRQLLDQVAHELATAQEWRDLFLAEPEVWGVEELALEGVLVRLVVRVRPLQQWLVARELRMRIKERFDSEGVVFSTGLVPRP